jgi:hypothetical protein
LGYGEVSLNLLAVSGETTIEQPLGTLVLINEKNSTRPFREIQLPKQRMPKSVKALVYGKSAALESAEPVRAVALTVTEPSDGTVVQAPRVLVRGSADADFRLYINGQERGVYGGGQEFEELVALQSGENTIIVKAFPLEKKMKGAQQSLKVLCTAVIEAPPPSAPVRAEVGFDSKAWLAESPSAVVSRLEMVRLLASLKKWDLKLQGNTSPAPDVAADSPDAPAISVALKHGYFRLLDNGTFGSAHPVSRAYAAVLATRYYGLSPAKVTRALAEDIPIDFWAGPHLQALINANLLSPPPRYFPNQPLTRAFARQLFIR